MAMKTTFVCLLLTVGVFSNQILLNEVFPTGKPFIELVRKSESKYNLIFNQGYMYQVGCCEVSFA